MIGIETNFMNFFDSLMNGINEYIKSSTDIFRPKPMIFIKKNAKIAKSRNSINEYDAAYFSAIEKRINEQDEELVKSGKDYYVYE
mgnify:CR=1 FL=1